MMIIIVIITISEQLRDALFEGICDESPFYDNVSRATVQLRQRAMKVPRYAIDIPLERGRTPQWGVQRGEAARRRCWNCRLSRRYQ